MKTVYVNAWQYNTGAGFDWYKEPKDAEHAFELEKINADDLADENWTAYMFCKDVVSYETATEEIDARLDELCLKAPIKYGDMVLCS